MIVRRARAHPGAQLSLFDTAEGVRHQIFITATHAATARCKYKGPLLVGRRP
jgi:hypothetical protein